MARGPRSGAGPCAAAVALMPVLFAAMGCNGETPLKLNFQSSSLPLPTQLQSPLSGAKGVGKGMSVEKRHIDGLLEENLKKAAHDPAGFHVMQACSGASTTKRAAHRPSSASFHRAQDLGRSDHHLPHKISQDRPDTSENPNTGKDGLLSGIADFCRHGTLPAFAFSAAESVCRAWMELECSQNRFLTLGTRVGRELLLSFKEHQEEQWKQRPVCDCEPHACSHPWAQIKGMQSAEVTRRTAGARVRALLWACKEAALLSWLENVKGICAVPAPEPLRGKNAARAIVGRAMRLWGQDVTQRILHGPLRTRSRFSAGRLARINGVLASACAGAGLGASGAAGFGASSVDAAIVATAGAAVFSTASVMAISRYCKGHEDGSKGLVLSAADANALLLGVSFLGMGTVGGRYGIGKTKLGDVILAGSFCQGCDFDGFANPHPSPIFGRCHEEDGKEVRQMTLSHIIACAPFSLTDCLLGCMGYMPASVRMAMADSGVRAAAHRGGALQAHSLGTLEARLLKANMAWSGTMTLLSPPPPFGWEEGTKRTCGRFDPICSGPLMSVAKHVFQAPVTYELSDICEPDRGVVHSRPYYLSHLAGADGRGDLLQFHRLRRP